MDQKALLQTYPRSIEKLGSQFDFLSRVFLKNFKEISWWPSFLRERRVALHICLIASVEFVLRSDLGFELDVLPELSVQKDFARSQGPLRRDPEFRILELNEALPEFSLDSGTWFFWPEAQKMKALLSRPEQKFFLEILEEGLNVDEASLMRLGLEAGYSGPDLEKSLLSLIKIGVIQVSRRT